MSDRPSLDKVNLSTERLWLRPWQATDAAPVFEAMQDRRMHEFLMLPDPYTREDATRFVTQLGNALRGPGTGLGCAVVEREGGRLVGSADLRFSPTMLLGADIGYAIYPWGQGNGYAAEASRALAEWAHKFGIGRVEIRCAVTNLASVATARAAGFGYEGVHRGQLRIPSGETDGACFARLTGDADDKIAPTFPPLGHLCDGVVDLRMITPDDAHAVWEQDTDDDTVEFGFHERGPSLVTVTEAARRAGLEWQVGTVASVAIHDVQRERFAGSIRLRLAGPPGVARVGYAVHPAFRGHGYATRALRLLAPWAFDVAGFARLELGAKVANVASCRTAEAAGFDADGIRAARLRNRDGSFSDEARYVLLNPQTVRRMSP